MPPFLFASSCGEIVSCFASSTTSTPSGCFSPSKRICERICPQRWPSCGCCSSLSSDRIRIDQIESPHCRLTLKPDAVVVSLTGLTDSAANLSVPVPRSRGNTYDEGHQRPEVAVLQRMSVLVALGVKRWIRTRQEHNAKIHSPPSLSDLNVVAVAKPLRFLPCRLEHEQNDHSDQSHRQPPSEGQ